MYFQSQVMSKYIVYANVFSLLLSSIVKITLILNEASLEAFAWTILFDSFVLACGFVYFYILNNRHSRLDRESSSKTMIQNLTFNKSTAVVLLRDSWPLILSGIVISIYMKIDQVMIMEMMDSEAVGQYAAAVRISELWYFIPMVIASSVFPAIINAKKQSEELYYARLQKLYDLMVWMAIAIALPMTFLSDWVVNLLYGEQYSQAGSVLMIHIWAGIFVGIAIVKGKWQTTENLTKYHFYGAFISAFGNVVFNYIFIPKYGISGAAYGTILAQAISAYVINFSFADLRSQNILIHNTLKIKRIFQ
jgi:O-antigen/teichoic acid export membrane protein